MAAPIGTGAWKPSIAWRDDQPIAFAPYELTHLDGAHVEQVSSMSDVVERTANRTVSTPRFDRLKRPMLDALTLRAEQARRKRSSLERSLSSADDAEGLRWAGEAILANAATIAPGASMLEWEGRRVDLYPTLSAAENAQSYFRRYRDARDAKRVVPPLIEQTNQELDYLDEMALHVELADNERDLTVLRRELETREILRAAKPKKDQKRAGTEQAAPRGPYLRIPLDDAEILAGTSALGNETVTFRMAGPDDLWFHVRGAPGAHVILRMHGQKREAPPELVQAAASVAASHSALREESHVPVDVTARRHVRKIAGAAPGRVTYQRETTLLVRPGAPDVVGAART
jgi:predicted ribosome quality control (RQC) complex YloA/Tae2 family protein